MPEGWTLPALNNRNRAWFTSGTVAVQSCNDCGELQHPPEEICHSCGSFSFGTQVLSGRGTVASYTIAHYPVNRALADHVPYAVVLVTLDDAPSVRVIGNVLGTPPEEITIGMAVEAVWEDFTAEDGDEIRLLQWRAR